MYVRSKAQDGNRWTGYQMEESGGENHVRSTFDRRNSFKRLRESADLDLYFTVKASYEHQCKRFWARPRRTETRANIVDKYPPSSALVPVPFLYRILPRRESGPSSSYSYPERSSLI